MSAPGMTNLNADTGPMSLLTEADLDASEAKRGRPGPTAGELVARVAVVVTMGIFAVAMVVHWSSR